MDTIRVVSLNARGLKNKLKRNALFHQIKSSNFDIVCLQECHITSKDAPVWEKQWGGKFIFHEGTTLSRGEVILLSKHFHGNVKI